MAYHRGLTTASLLALAVAAACGSGTAMAQSAGANNDEIVVTAQRRTENLQDVPVSVTALSGDALTVGGIVSTQDLGQAVPGLTWGRSTAFNQPAIRGVGNRNASAGDESNVATFIDGVYMPEQTATLTELANVERVEVLKGPQGTLFGRNATGGAINIVTRKPSFDFAAQGSASAGSFGYYKLSGGVTGGLIDDVLAVSVAGLKFDDSGYIRNVITGRRQGSNGGFVVRGKILVQATPDLSFQINGLHSKTDNNVLLSGQPLNANSTARPLIIRPLANPNGYTAAQLFPLAPRQTSVMNPFSDVKQDMVDLHAEWDIGFATLSGLASFGKTSTELLFTSEASALMSSQSRISSNQKWRNQELVLASNGDGPLSWILGFTGYQANANFAPLLSDAVNATTGVRSTSTILYGQKTSAIAFFGEATYQIVDNVYLTGGARYSKDKRSAYNQVNGGVITRNSRSWDDVTFRAVARWEFDADSNIYASYTEGFKSGVFNAVTANGVNFPAAPEKIRALELGYKAILFPGLRINVAAFHYDYSDLQVSAAVNINGNSLTILQNAASAKINGFEADISYKPVDGLTLTAGLSLLRPIVGNFPNASIVRPITVGGVPTLNGNTSVIASVSGNDLARAPRTTLTIGANYKIPIGSGELELAANAFFSGKYFFELSNRGVQPSYEVVNASVTYHFPGDKFFVSAFVQNLTDQDYQLGQLNATASDMTAYAKPRWFGGTVGFNF